MNTWYVFLTPTSLKSHHRSNADNFHTLSRFSRICIEFLPTHVFSLLEPGTSYAKR